MSKVPRHVVWSLVTCNLAMMVLAIAVNLLPVFLTTIAVDLGSSECASLLLLHRSDPDHPGGIAGAAFWSKLVQPGVGIISCAGANGNRLVLTANDSPLKCLAKIAILLLYFMKKFSRNRCYYPFG